MEDSLEFPMKYHEEGEHSGQCSPGNLLCETSSPSSLFLNDLSSSVPGSTVVNDVGDKHSTKDI